ncbi:MAG TPA: hypothetical protein VJ741_05745 [Solirubrobacteraceae bacterium]|nr:hypothetical protein [Solirubrobacteraceae bacterium]
MTGLYGRSTGYYGSSNSTGFYGGSGKTAAPKPHGVGGFLSNLLGDVRDAAVGLPEGLIQTAEHPIHTAELGAKATWHDWSPLFHGHAGQWWHNFYSHPLAPLLDVATVFTAGGAAAGKLADLGVLGEESKLASTEGNITRILKDSSEAGRPDMVKYLSRNPATRLRQNATFNLTTHLADHLPSWFGDHVLGPGASYERSYSKFLTHRSAAHSEITAKLMQAAGDHAKVGEALSKLTSEQAKNLPDWASAAHAQLAAELHAGKSLSEIDTRKVIEPALYKYNLDNFIRNAIPWEDGKALPKGYGYVKQRSLSEKLLQFHPRDGDFEQKMQRWGGITMTRRVSRAARTDGKLLIAPTKAAYALGHEAANSARFLKKLWRTPSTIWKYALVGYSPRTVIDNGVGNWTMLALRQGGHHLLPGIVDTVKQLKGARDAAKVLKVSGLSNHWTDMHFLDELNAGFAHSLQEPLTKGNKLVRTAKQGFYPLVHSLADQPVRRTALNAFMHDAPEVRAFRRQGMGFDQAVESALAKHPTLRGRAVDHIRKIAGDYTGLTPTEQVVRGIIPFYTWDRHILSHTVDMFGEHPGRLAAMQQVSNQGVAKTKKAFGVNLPDFLLGDIPLGKASGPQGRISALATTGLNPYSTVPDVANAIAALGLKEPLSPGETIGGQLNPLAAGLIEQLSGERLGSTQPIPMHGGVLPSILVNTGESLPYARLISSLVGKGQGSTYTSQGKTEQHLYEGSPSELVSQLLGFPRKRVSPSAAERLFTQQQPKAKKRKSAKGFYG